MSRSVAVVVLLGAVACQQYDFEAVEPAAFTFQVVNESKSGTNLRPNVVVLLDRSGSMAQPIDPQAPACPVGCATSGLGCPAGCATRMSELRAAMSSFFGGPARELARWGLAVYPAQPQGDQCSAATGLEEPLPPPAVGDGPEELATWAAGAARIDAAIQQVTPGGGTPTAASLAFLGGVRELGDPADQRADFVLLLTDGLPNCNAANPKNVCGDPSAAQQQACACTLASCGGVLCAQGCLDEDASVAQVRALRERGISTLVVGFGADTGGASAARVLGAMASAGGFPRRCSVSADCGAGDACSGGLCGRAYYQASNGAELTARLREVVRDIARDPCRIELGGALTDPVVSLRAGDTWYAEGPESFRRSGTTVFLQGELCARAWAATPAAPLNIEVRVVERL